MAPSQTEIHTEGSRSFFFCCVHKTALRFFVFDILRPVRVPRRLAPCVRKLAFSSTRSLASLFCHSEIQICCEPSSSTFPRDNKDFKARPLQCSDATSFLNERHFTDTCKRFSIFFARRTQTAKSACSRR